MATKWTGAAGENFCRALDLSDYPETGRLYAGLETIPGKVVKISRPTMGAVLTRTLPEGDNNVYALITDGYMVYPGLYIVPAKVYKLERSSLTTDDSWAGASGEDRCAALVQDDDYIYVGLHTDPAKVIKIQKSDMTTVDSWTAPVGNPFCHGLAQDASFVYAGLSMDPAKVFKIQKSDMTTVDSWVGTIGEEVSIEVLIIDGGILYAGLYMSPSKILRIDVADAFLPPITIFDDGGVDFWVLIAGVETDDTTEKQVGNDSYKVVLSAQTLDAYHNYDTDQDFSTKDIVKIWIYGANTGATIRLEFWNEVYASKTNGYYYSITDNFSGWRLFEIQRTSFADIGTPTGWDHIRCVRLLGSGNVTATYRFDWFVIGNPMTKVDSWVGATGENSLRALCQDGTYLYAGLALSPYQVIRIVKSTLLTHSKHIGESGENNCYALVQDTDYVYAGLFISPAEVIKLSKEFIFKVVNVWGPPKGITSVI